MPRWSRPSAGTPLFGTSVMDVDARQKAMARYTRTGFEAAAVTGLAVLDSMMQRRAGLIRTARLEFVHPYAVVAIAMGNEVWAGLPVFSGWVVTPDEPD